MMEHGFVRVVKEAGLRSAGSHLVGSIPTARITRMSEWLRRQIQDLLRKLMGSNPISCTPPPAVVAQWQSTRFVQSEDLLRTHNQR